MRLAIMAVVLLLASPALADTMVVERRGDQSLPATLTVDEVRAVVVAADWLHVHPNKKVSTWESRRLVFGATEVTITTPTLNPTPIVSKYPWKVVRGGARPVIQIDRYRFTFGVCRGDKDRKRLCLEGRWI